MSIDSLPVELLKAIAIELPDKDLCSFSLSCSVFYSVVNADQMVWRARFLRSYDTPMKGRKNEYDWRKTYQTRERLLRRKLRDIVFEDGNSKEEKEALEALQDLLLDARGHLSSDAKTVKGRNFEHIYAAKPPLSLAQSCLHNLPNPLLQAVNLLLTPIFSLPGLEAHERTQEMALCPMQYPAITKDGFPNLLTLEALSQYFIFHTHASSESFMYHQRTLLQPYELPSFWEGSLNDETRKIPTKWFGAYGRSSGTMYPASDDYLVEMTISFGPDGHQFTGTGRDYQPFKAHAGNISSLPQPPRVSAIPGWKKVQFVKDYGSHRWWYEGVMLPGNNMILGHWAGGDYGVRRIHGPFVFWVAPEFSTLESRDNRLSLHRVIG